jgi:hypothetical protein
MVILQKQFISPQLPVSFQNSRKSLTSCDEDERLLSFISSSELVPTSILEVKAPQTTTSFTAAVEASRVEGEIISEPEAPSHIQKVHPPLQIIGNLNKRVTHFLRSAHLSYFLSTLFVTLLSLEILDTFFLIRVGSMLCMRS